MKASFRKGPTIEELLVQEKQRRDFEACYLAEAEKMYAELCKLADAMGFSLRQMAEVGMQQEHPLPKMYINPLNIKQRWYGRGRKPTWLVDWEASGKSLNHVIF